MGSKMIIELDIEKLFDYPQYVKKGSFKPKFYFLLKELEYAGEMILAVVKDNLPDDKRDNIYEAIKWVEEMTKLKEK
ncbi:unnamed protein product [marine sediment metagenome]|uniref:Uncharacterized protein n=1 Tax=marine sediment metagenome TaxID=412755 RepID=X1JXF6_9ZZZZ